MELLSLSFWPVWLAAAVMILAAIVNARRGSTIPNKLTFRFLIAGLLVGIFHSVGVHPDHGEGGLLDCLAGIVLCLVLALPAYAFGLVGAGSVKLQMGLSAWITAFYGA